MGVLVSPNSPDALADGLVHVLREPARYAKTREAITAVFEPVRSIDEYEALFRRLVATTV
jgi:hypothetical protein